jgi:hypothetical protein
VGVEVNHIQEKAKHLVRQSIQHLVSHHNQADWAPIDSDLNVEANETWGQVMLASEKVGALVWVMAPSFQTLEAPSLATSIELEMALGALGFQAVASEREFEVQESWYRRWSQPLASSPSLTTS